ncbi:kinesin light chain-like [Sabethes cyaneus]|uniref:kinesin light chain-like n=1 Tax=Sabethes cyaneus TaxID=53552 RepID=UPI00237EA994|nr:kinesin light chain-like [Sabethes cyaneus]
MSQEEFVNKIKEMTIKCDDSSGPHSGKERNELADHWTTVGRPTEKSQQQSSIAHRSKNTGYREKLSGREMHNLILKYSVEGNHTMVILLCEEAIDDLTKKHGRNHRNVATVLNILGLTYRDLGRYEEAKDVINEVLVIREKTHKDNHPLFMATLSTLSALHGKCRIWPEAARHSTRLLEIRKRTLGKYHPDVAWHMYSLASIYRNQHKYDKCEFYCKQALHIFESIFGPHDLNVAKTSNGLASCYIEQGKFDDAERMYKQVLTRVHERKFGPIDDNNKPIWQIAEEHEANRIKRDNTPYSIYGNWHRVDVVNCATVKQALQYLAGLYGKKGLKIAACTVVKCVMRMTDEHIPCIPNPRFPRKRCRCPKNGLPPVINRLRREKQYK